jgi:hypothetical protein
MTMTSQLIMDRESLYVVALIWNLATIGWLFWINAKRDKTHRRILNGLKETFPLVTKVLRHAGRAPGAAKVFEAADLQKIMHFSRNPRAFNYTIPELAGDLKPLLKQVQERLEQETASGVSEHAKATASPSISEAEARSVELTVTKTEEDLARLNTGNKARRILLVGTIGNWIILILMIILHFQSRASF